MDIHIPYYFFRLFENDKMDFICQGEISEELTEQTISLGERSIRHTVGFTHAKKKISFVIAECLRNLIRYEEKPRIVHQTNNRPAAFMVRNAGSSYYIVSSNLIKQEKVDALKAKLNKINELGLEELKKIEKGLDANEKKPGKKSSGLGLMEITKKSGYPLRYDFEYVNFYLSCFYLQVKLVVKNRVQKMQDIPLNKTKDILHKVLEKNIILLYKGNFSQQAMLPVLGMLETNLKKDVGQYGTRKKVFYFVVELLQNMSKHALERNGLRQGILAICKKGKSYSIYSGNFVALSKVEELKNYVEKINSMEKSQLSALYKKHLFDGKTRSKGGAGLGLIDMTRYSTDKPVFNFQSNDNESAFCSFGFSI